MSFNGCVKHIAIKKDKIIDVNGMVALDTYTGVMKFIRNEAQLARFKQRRSLKENPATWPMARKIGHHFQVEVNVTFTANDGRKDGDSRCSLEWWENTSRPYPVQGQARLRPDTWTNLYEEDWEGPTNAMFQNWFEIVRDVKEAGDAKIKILDYPNLTADGGDRARVLYFCVVAKCTPGCKCGETWKAATAVQGVAIEHGVPRYFFMSFPVGRFVNYDGRSPCDFKPDAFLEDIFR